MSEMMPLYRFGLTEDSPIKENSLVFKPSTRYILLKITILLKGIKMPWVPWIQIEKDDSTKEEVQQLYEKTRNSLTGKISDLTRLTSLTPEVSIHLDSLCSAVYKNASGLTPREKEIAALVTSSFVGCVH
jgi:hypothetical protein